MLNLNSLRQNWTAADQASIGRTIYRAIRSDQRGDWAGSILLYVTSEVFVCDVLTKITGISYDELRWQEACEAFRVVRSLTIANEKNLQHRLPEQLVLAIGETAAKVICNASRAGSFHHHAGWRMASRLRRSAEAVARPEFEEDCWRLLVRRQAD